MSELTLAITGLRVATRIGVLDWERQVDQNIIVDLTYTISADGVLDQDLTTVCDYAALSDYIRITLADSDFCLIESLVKSLADSIKDRFKQILRLELVIHKPGAIRGAKDVCVRYAI